MSNSVSISFKKGDEESVALFSHWGGDGLVAAAKRYASELSVERRAGGVLPLDRLEPQTVMVDFIRYIVVSVEGLPERINSDYYLGRTPEDGDNLDNGHHVISLD